MPRFCVRITHFLLLSLASMVIALAGNKTDLAGQREVPTDVAQAYATENGLLFMETSVGRFVDSDGINVTVFAPG